MMTIIEQGVPHVQDGQISMHVLIHQGPTILCLLPLLSNTCTIMKNIVDPVLQAGNCVLRHYIEAFVVQSIVQDCLISNLLN